MRNRILLAAGLLAMFASVPSHAARPNPSLPNHADHPAAGKPLRDLLRAIETPSGVRFRVASEVAGDPIQMPAVATTAWPDIIRGLLRGYNYAATWTPAGKLAEVNVTGRNGDGTAPAAAAPATADLFAYQPPAKAVPAQYRGYAAGSVYPIRVPAERLRKMGKGERISASLPDGRYQLVHDNAWKHDNGDLTWVGYLDGPQGRYRALLTVGDGALAGQILTPGGLYKLESDATGEWLVDIDASGLRRGSLEGDEGNPASLVLGGVGLASAAAASESRMTDSPGATQPTGAASIQNGKATIDLLLLYTSGMATPKVSTRLNHLVALVNQALVDSQVNAVFRLVAARPISYPDRGGNSAALDDLTQSNKGLRGVPSLRAKKGADVVILVRPFKPNSQGGNCGIAWVNGSENTELMADQGFGVIGYGSANGYYCSDYTLAHEIGHVMGATHDRPHASVQGKFPFSYGYGIANRFGDIMSYYDPEVGVYSNPDLRLCDGSPCGIPPGNPSAADVALTFNKTAATVSRFTKSVTP